MPHPPFSYKSYRILHTRSLIFPLKDARQKAEYEIIQKALIRNAWNISRTAEDLGISRPTLHDLINKYKIKVRRQ